jgi:hypothetical protein
VSFLDEDELDPAPSGPSRRAPADRQRQVLVRRVIALLVGVAILILLLLGVRGCLNAREERGFENYLSDLDSIVAQSNQLSTEFFTRLVEPEKGLKELQLEAQITTDRGTAESLLQRVEGLDAPDDVAGAQDELVQSFELRRDGLAGIADDIPSALATEGRTEAIGRMVADMEAFLASDVLFERARTDINATAAEDEVDGTVDESVFLPRPAAQWLDSVDLTVILNSFASATGNVPAGTHGVELVSGGVSIDKTTLSPDFDNTVGLGNAPPQLTVGVLNIGDVEEKDVLVTYSLSGGATTTDGEATIASIDAGGQTEASATIEPVPETDVPLTLTVEVVPVLGEQVAEDNRASYTITFN